VEKGQAIIIGVKINWYKHYEKNRVSSKKIEQSFDSGIPPFGVYLKEMKC
jgi:hypothetical protein